jgi:hypothetical protein
MIAAFDRPGLTVSRRISMKAADCAYNDTERLQASRRPSRCSDASCVTGSFHAHRAAAQVTPHVGRELFDRLQGIAHVHMQRRLVFLDQYTIATILNDQAQGSAGAPSEGIKELAPPRPAPGYCSTANRTFAVLMRAGDRMPGHAGALPGSH